MTTKKATRRALFTSIMALVMCLVMLVGTTFAWFTDSVTSGVNTIQSGNLDVELEYKNTTTNDFTKVTPDTNVFKTGTLWEPGHVEYAVLKVSNVGSLALKYALGINVANETGSVNVAGEPFNLSDHLQFAVLENDQSGLGRDAMVTAAETAGHKALSAGYQATGSLLARAEAAVVTLVVWMPTTVGNEANYDKANGAAQPTIDLGISLTATQEQHEEDSFGRDYDAGAAAALPTLTVNREGLNSLTLADLKKDGVTNPVVEVTLGNTAAEQITYSEHSSGYTGQGVLLGSTELNHYGTAPAAAGEYTFIFKNGTINSAATGYTSIDGYSDTSVYMLVPGNSDVVFENMTFNGVVSFDVQKYTSPWSNLNAITFKNCTFNGIIIGTCPASNVTFDGCTFSAYTNTTSANNSNPIWWREDTEGSGANANPIKTFNFVNNTVIGTRPVKIERIGKTVSPVFTIKNNTFDISAQAGDTNTKNMAINIGMGENPNLPFTLIDEGNTISATTAALYTASLTGGSNWYKEMPGMKVVDGSGNDKVITAMVWKTTTGETFELKSAN